MKLIDQLEKLDAGFAAQLLMRSGYVVDYNRGRVCMSPRELSRLLNKLVYESRNLEQATEELTESILTHVNRDSGEEKITEQDARNTAANIAGALDFYGRRDY